MTILRPCERCSTDFAPLRSWQRFCSLGCKRRARWARREAANNVAGTGITLSCHHCGAQFLHVRAGGRRPHRCPDCRAKP